MWEGEDVNSYISQGGLRVSKYIKKTTEIGAQHFD